MSGRPKETPEQAYERTRKWLDASEDPAQTPVCECAKQERCDACNPPLSPEPDPQPDQCGGSSSHSLTRKKQDQERDRG